MPTNNNIKQIIRLEHPKDGIGIFTNRVKFNLYSTKLGNKILKRHIDLMEDANVINGFTFNHYCAYKSIIDLNKFIKPSELKHLINRDIVILLLEVKDFIEGENQILYLKEDIVTSKDITELFK